MYIEYLKARHEGDDEKVRVAPDRARAAAPGRLAHPGRPRRAVLRGREVGPRGAVLQPRRRGEPALVGVQRARLRARDAGQARPRRRRRPPVREGPPERPEPARLARRDRADGRPPPRGGEGLPRRDRALERVLGGVARRRPGPAAPRATPPARTPRSRRRARPRPSCATGSNRRVRRLDAARAGEVRPGAREGPGDREAGGGWQGRPRVGRRAAAQGVAPDRAAQARRGAAAVADRDRAGPDREDLRPSLLGPAAPGADEEGDRRGRPREAEGRGEDASRSCSTRRRSRR